MGNMQWVGGLLCLATLTRDDLAYSVGVAAQLEGRDVENAAYTPTKGQTKSPHELFWGEVPGISLLRVFARVCCIFHSVGPEHFLQPRINESCTHALQQRPV